MAQEIQELGGESLIFRADMRDASQVGGMIKAAMQQWEGVHVLVNNAGLTRDGLLVRMPEQDWDDVLEVNLKGPFLSMRAVSEVMKRQREGHIINIASITGVQGREGQANYSAAKAGLVGLTRAAARELGPYNIKINTVLPGYMKTDMGAAALDSIRERALCENALGKLSDPTEVAEFIVHLTTMRNVSGQIFNLDSRII